jgi:hypothetical protein
MNTQFGFTKWLVISMALFGVATLAYCATPSSFWQGKIDFEYTGQVLDVDTNAPIEGAYVLAIYERVDLGLAGAARYCVKTKGMTTGKDGRFNFPMERINNITSPAQVAAIKTDYYHDSRADFTDKEWRAKNKATFSNRHIYLKKQDPADLKFNYGYTTCERPESREAVAANLEFLKLKRNEVVRIGSHVNGFKRSVEIYDRQISDFENFIRN